MTKRCSRYAAVLAVAIVGCGDNTEVTPDAAVAVDAAGFVVAPHGTAPQLVSLGGSVLATPKVRAIFFTGDDAVRAQIDAFHTALTTAPYWAATTTEYGVGPLTISPTIVSTDAPPTTDSALTAWLAAKLDGTNLEWGAVEPNTIYAIFYPAGAVLQSPFGDSCDAYAAFHDEATGAHGESIVYAFMPRCQFPGGMTFDELTNSASHEYVEAATDPHVETTAAYGSVDDAHAIWGFTPGAENGDFCEYLPDAYQRIVGDFMVQRAWSNAAATAGHDPCVPALAGPYVSAAPMLTESVHLSDGPSGPVATEGVVLAVGASKTIDVALFSDAEAADWTVEAVDVASDYFGDPAELTFTWDKTTGHNGDTLHLTIKRTRAGAGGFGGSEFVIVATANQKMTSMWWAVAGG